MEEKEIKEKLEYIEKLVSAIGLMSVGMGFILISICIKLFVIN